MSAGWQARINGDIGLQVVQPGRWERPSQDLRAASIFERPSRDPLHQGFEKRHLRHLIKTTASPEPRRTRSYADSCTTIETPTSCSLRLTASPTPRSLRRGIRPVASLSDPWSVPLAGRADGGLLVCSKSPRHWTSARTARAFWKGVSRPSIYERRTLKGKAFPFIIP